MLTYIRTHLAYIALANYFGSTICIDSWKMWIYKLFTSSIDLKTSLSNFIERETNQDYDRISEQVLQNLLNGEVDISELTNTWAKAYSEVGMFSSWSMEL